MEPATHDAATTSESRAASPSSLERVLLGLLLVAAVVLRLSQLGEPLDRQFDGFQGAFFAICAVNYERLDDAGVDVRGVPVLPDGAGSGYPVVNLELDTDDRSHWFLYANHPPTVAWLAWGGLTLFGPDGWQDAWREGRAPEGFEAALRAPFLALHLLGLGALFAALCAAGCRRAAWYATALYAYAPASMLYAGLVNYENPTLPFILLGAASVARYLRSNRRRWLAATAAAFACAGAMTYAPIFTAGALALVAVTHGLRRGVFVATATIAGTLAPLVIHGAAAGALLADHGQAPGTLVSRVRIMIEPLLDGSTPFGTWLATQINLVTSEIGVLISLLAAAGLIVALRGLRAQYLRQPRSAPDQLAGALALALTLGGGCVQLAFYRHTRDPQDPFILHLIPGMAALGGVLLARLSSTQRLFPMLAALALVAGTTTESTIRSANLHRRWRSPLPPPGQASDNAPQLPPPHVLGPALAELIPAGQVAWYPDALGLNPATSFYSWRTLLPVNSSNYGASELVQAELGLAGVATWLVIPTQIPRSAQAAADALLLDLEAALPGSTDEPTASNTAWRAWRLR